MKKLLLFIIVFVLAVGATNAQLRLPGIFSDHMVLQQQSEVAIWGWTSPSADVTVTASWDLNPTPVKALNSGAWKTTLKTPAAGGPFTVSVKSHQEIVIKDVLIGEVWICSGQSNMEWGLASSSEGAEEIPKAVNKDIRLFQVAKSAAQFPQLRGEGIWQVCSPETVRNFSAVGYFFGKRLNADLKIPVGLINSSWGGTPAEVWTPKEKVESDPAIRASAEKLKDAPWSPHDAGVVYNSMIYPIVPFGIAGALWYQGESNAAAPGTYQKLMKILIESWRSDFGKEFPFYYVQIAPYKYGRQNEGVLVREQQAKTLSVPKTGMVVISDVVDNLEDIHPKSKRPVGERLANLALGDTYKRPILGYQSPVYKSMTVEKGKIRIDFEYAKIGLISQGGDPKLFEIAGADQKFYPATAKIDGGTVLVSAKEVKVPVAVRFAWSNTAVPNLFNKEGLPVTSFRTDDWEVDMSPIEAKK